MSARGGERRTLGPCVALRLWNVEKARAALWNAQPGLAKTSSQLAKGHATMTQRLKNHSDEPPSILAWTFRAPIPRPGSVGDRTRGWGARREVPGGAYH